jgi:hypothetical protein
MFKAMHRFIQWLMSEAPNIERLSIASSVPVYLGLAIFHTLKTHDFNGMDFGGGIAALVGGISAVLGLRDWAASKREGNTDGPNTATS